MQAANKQFATETIQAFFPPINLKMATSSNGEGLEDVDEIKHYLEVINEDHSTCLLYTSDAADE